MCDRVGRRIGRAEHSASKHGEESAVNDIKRRLLTPLLQAEWLCQ